MHRRGHHLVLPLVRQFLTIRDRRYSFVREDYACARRLAECATLALMVTGAGELAAQPTAAIAGMVADTAGNPLFGATVLVADSVGASLSAVTDERGEFRIGGVKPGNVELRARRLGFAPTVRQTRVGNQREQRLDLRMTPLPTTLAPVVVQTSNAEFRGRLAGYYERLRRRSGGQFITREMLEKKKYRSLSQILGQSPSVRAIGLRSGGGAVRMRGNSCRPLVWLDGVPMPAGEVDLDAFPVSTLHGVELYLGQSTTPPDYTQSGMSNCGTILLWSRGRDTEQPPSQVLNRIDLDSLVTSMTVYTADQVDVAAKRESLLSTDLDYPPDLLAEGTGGSVLTQFVVDRDGKIESGTITIVSSTHDAFSAVAARALRSAVFTPAKKSGQAVRQVVQQPFLFTPGSGASRTR